MYDNSDKKEQWHIPFYASYEIDFRQYEDILEIDPAHLLEQSSEVDILSVKKVPGAQIDNGIGEVYRHHNLIEYKSPDDRLGFEAYLQIMGYAYLYMRLEGLNTFDEVLVSLMGYNFPKKMIEQLAGMGYTCDKTEEGVYLLSHTHLIPVQVVLIDKIDAEKYPWISVIRKKISDEDALRVLHQLSGVNTGRYIEKAREVTDLVIRRLTANNQKEGVFKMNETRNLFKEEFEEKDRMIQDLSEELKESREELKSKDSMIEKLKTEIVKLGGNVAMF